METTGIGKQGETGKNVAMTPVPHGFAWTGAKPASTVPAAANP